MREQRPSFFLLSEVFVLHLISGTFRALCRDPDLGVLEQAARMFKLKAMWSCVSNCDPNATKIFGEPYCGGPTGQLIVLSGECPS